MSNTLALSKPSVADELVPAPHKVSVWQARLDLAFAHSGRGTRLIKNAHEGPLRVQRPFYPEGDDVSHVYVLHPPGGLVSGDELVISIDAGAKSHGLITMPGAGRVYRARPDKTLQRQTVNLSVEEGAVLEWLPLETILFNGAHTQLDTLVNLAVGAAFIGWDITSLGRPANHIEFTEGQLRQSFRVAIEGVPQVIERMNIDTGGNNPYAQLPGLQSNPVTGVFIAGPLAAIDESLMDLLRAVGSDPERPFVAGISLVGQFIVGRYLGGCTEQGRNVFEKWWTLLRPVLLGREVSRPRIWLT